MTDRRSGANLMNCKLMTCDHWTSHIMTHTMPCDNRTITFNHELYFNVLWGLAVAATIMTYNGTTKHSGPSYWLQVVLVSIYCKGLSKKSKKFKVFGYRSAWEANVFTEQSLRKWRPVQLRLNFILFYPVNYPVDRINQPSRLVIKA